MPTRIGRRIPPFGPFEVTGSDIIFTGNLCASDPNGPCLMDEAASLTNPTVIPDQSDPTTGVNAAAGAVGFCVSGVRRFDVSTSVVITGLNLVFSAGGGPTIRNVGSTALLPPLVHNSNDTTSGVGGVTGTLSLITGGVEAINIDANQDISVQAGGLSVPATEKIIFDGSTGQNFIHEASINTLKIFTGNGERISINNARTLFQQHNGWASENAVTCAAAATTFAVGGSSNITEVTGDGGGNTIATITGALVGIYVFKFVDALVTITDDNSHAANTVDLSAAFTSADDTTLTLMFDGTSWYEIGRSVN